MIGFVLILLLRLSRSIHSYNHCVSLLQGTAIATASENRDPNRSHWLMELILEEPVRVEQVCLLAD